MPPAASPNAFLYVAIKTGGGRKLGMRPAKSRPALADALRKERLLLMKAWEMPAWAAPQQKIAGNDHLILNEQLAALLSRGVPLVEALDVASQTVPERARPIVRRMKDLVAAGSSFSDACATVGTFDTVSIAVYRASERTGDLAGAAKQLATTQRRTLAVAGRAVTLMIYPVIVLCISIVVAFGMMTVIVPQIAETLSQFGDVPWFSRMVMGTGTWMRDHVVWILLAVAIFVFTMLVMRKPLVVLIGHISRRAPLIRDVILAQESVRFFSVMAAMSRSGVPLAESLGVSNQAINHPKLRTQMDKLRTKLIEGGTLRVLIDQVDAFPLATRKLLIAAERAGDLESAFNSLSADMADEVERRSNRLLSVLQPAMIIFMFVVIGSLLMALLIPMVTLGGNVAK